MRYETDRFTKYYYAIAALLGIVAAYFSIWYGIAIWALVAMGIFHEPVHWLAAKHFGIPVLTMANKKSGAYLEVPGESRELGYVALAGPVFDLAIAGIVCIALAMAGSFVAGELWVAAVLMMEVWYSDDLRTFWRLAVQNRLQTDSLK